MTKLKCIGGANHGNYLEVKDGFWVGDIIEYQNYNCGDAPTLNAEAQAEYEEAEIDFYIVRCVRGNDNETPYGVHYLGLASDSDKESIIKALT